MATSTEDNSATAVSSPEDNEMVESDQKRCTYCFQELNEMRDPRQLPCTHIACITCLQNDWKLEKLECRACSTPAEVENLESLPQVKESVVKAKMEIEETYSASSCFNCDVCKTPMVATTYCVECGKKSCVRHTEHHEEYHSQDGHNVLDIKMYGEVNESYERRACDFHPTNFIRHACRKCYKMPCSYCVAGDCSEDGDHTFRLIADVAEEIKVEIEVMLKTCSVRISELCNSEKQTWVNVDNLTEKCQTLTREIDESTAQQIADIKQKSEALKQQIQECYNDCLSRVEGYINELTSKVESLEQTHLHMKRFIRQEQPSTIVQLKMEKVEELSKANAVDTKEFSMLKISLRTKATEGFNDTKLVLTSYMLKPLNFSKSFSLSPGNPLHAISFTPSGNVYFGCGDYILNYNSDLQLVEKWNENNGYTIRCLQQMPQAFNKIYYIASNNVFRIPSDLSQTLDDIVYSVSFTCSNHHSQMAVSANYMVISNVQSHQIMIHNIVTGTNRYFNLPATSWIRSLCFDDSGDLLILDSELSSVSKYKINDGDDTAPTLMWRCGGIEGPYAMCINAREGDETIYVSGTGQKLHVIKDGELVGVMHNEKLPVLDGCHPSYTTIAVFGNRFLTSQNNSNILLEFEML